MRSHQKAMAAIQAGKFDDETVPVPVSFTVPHGVEAEAKEIDFYKSTKGRALTLRLKHWRHSNLRFT